VVSQTSVPLTYKNGIHARLLAKLTQYAVIIFWRNVDQYFQGYRTILAGTKNIWWLSFCINPLPVAGQVALMLFQQA
jgi:hypothetical protein